MQTCPGGIKERVWGLNSGVVIGLEAYRPQDGEKSNCDCDGICLARQVGVLLVCCSVFFNFLFNGCCLIVVVCFHFIVIVLLFSFY